MANNIPIEQLLNMSWAADFQNKGYDGEQGVRIRINPQFASEVTERANAYKNFPHRLRPALEKVADYVRFQMIPRTFHDEGPGWRRLARRTVRERLDQGYGGQHPILVRSGDLFKELTDKGHPHHIEIIKTGRRARVEISGSSDKFIRNQAGNFEYHIPPRPMIPGTGGLPVPDRDSIAIRRILANAIGDIIHG